jgi:hypothetical protein
MNEASKEKLDAVELYLSERRRIKAEKTQAKWRRANAKKRAKYKRRQHHLARYKLAKGCHRCGYNQHPSALYFYHVHGKNMKIVKAVEYSLATLFKELRKTIVCCANCVAIATSKTNKSKGDN